mgnify:CR=1 FL=1
MAYRNENENLKAHVTTLRVIIAVLFLFIGGMGIGWDRARQDAVFHVPPNLDEGGLVKANDPKRIHIYTFASRIIQIINHWQTDGSVDYGKAIDSVKPYLTPRFYAELKDDLKQRMVNPVDGLGTPVDELTGRVRAMQPIVDADTANQKIKIFDDAKVAVHGNGAWTATLDMHIDEQVKGMNVKSINVRYPIRVIRYDVDLNANPWGLALDGYEPPGPTRLAASQDQAKASNLGQAPTTQSVQESRP